MFNNTNTHSNMDDIKNFQTKRQMKTHRSYIDSVFIGYDKRQRLFLGMDIRKFMALLKWN